MSKNINDIVFFLNICLSSVEKRMAETTDERIKSYLDGYRDAFQIILSEIDKGKDEKGI